ncbi:ribose transport system substrate-binding protein [Anoxybacillus tepidamans]|uniref:histidine kinase n=1 Tax=Anoxybacteroides tepidamans TaxID=265948 RepID=A0A7W8IRU4_9BACL|nr:ATP-binding protein [Anoxybacillus tepidamans]MBB5325474.1 ribose transport system substrate-binding protein [Anoxybacillus tepidamans]
MGNEELLTGVLIVDYEQKIVAINQSFCDIAGIHEPPHLLIGKNCEEYDSYLQHLGVSAEAADKVIISNGKMFERKHIPCYIGNNRGSLWVFSNITTPQNTEPSGVKGETEKAAQSYSELISKMSHELRTPLNGILGFAQLLDMDSTLSSQQREFVREILSGARHLLNLVNGMSDLARAEAGRLNVTCDVVKIDSIVEESIKLVQPLAERKKIRIVNEMNSSCYVLVDPTRIRQILFNLLENAVKYNKENGVVKIMNTYDEEKINIHVQDTGIGIPDEEFENIFKPFYRIKGTNADGTGIGLSLVKQFVQSMGGTVGVNSKIGAGSDFWFSLPIVQRARHDHLQRDDIAPYIEKVKQIGPKKILYIEDRLSNIKLMEKILAPFPELLLFSATCGKEGLDIASAEQIDLIFLDMNLPDMNGYEVLEQLKRNERTSSIPVIALSANVMPTDIEKALSKGFEGYLAKPLDLKRCFEKIQQVLTRNKKA